jgi:hypothetical protein
LFESRINSFVQTVLQATEFQNLTLASSLYGLSSGRVLMVSSTQVISISQIHLVVSNRNKTQYFSLKETRDSQLSFVNSCN